MRTPLGLTGFPAPPSFAAPVEGQEHGGFAGQVGAEPDFVLVNGEVDGAAARLEQVFPRAAAAAVLLHGVGHGLLGETVLELKSGNGRPLTNKARSSLTAVVVAVAQLAGNGKAVLGVAGRRGVVARRGRSVEQRHRVLAAPDAVAQYVDDAAIAHLAIEAGEELASGGVVVVQGQGGRCCGLGCSEEGR